MGYGDVRKQKVVFMQTTCMKQHAGTTLPEGETDTGEGQSMSVQFVFDTEDVFSHAWLKFFVVLVLSDPMCWDPFLLLYLFHLAHPQQQGPSQRRLSSS